MVADMSSLKDVEVECYTLMRMATHPFVRERLNAMLMEILQARCYIILAACKCLPNPNTHVLR